MARLFTDEEVRQMIADAMAKAVAPLKARIAELEAEAAQLKKNSTTSSKPPSSDIVAPPRPKSLSGIGGVCFCEAYGDPSIPPPEKAHEQRPAGVDLLKTEVEEMNTRTVLQVAGIGNSCGPDGFHCALVDRLPIHLAMPPSMG